MLWGSEGVDAWWCYAREINTSLMTVPSGGWALSLRCLQQVAGTVQPTDANPIFARRERAAAGSWRFGRESCTISKVSSQPYQSFFSSWASATEQHWVRGRGEARELVGVSSRSPFAQKPDFDQVFGEPC